MRPARIRLFPVGPLVPVPRLTEEQCGLVDEIGGRCRVTKLVRPARRSSSTTKSHC